MLETMSSLVSATQDEATADTIGLGAASPIKRARARLQET